MINIGSEIIRLKTLTGNLISAYEKKVILIHKLEEKSSRLEIENKDYKHKITELEEKTEILKTAKTISLSEKDKTEVKEKINKIVREIDKSIGLLNE